MAITIKTLFRKETKQLHLRHVHKSSLEQEKLKQAFTEKKNSPFLVAHQCPSFAHQCPSVPIEDGQKMGKRWGVMGKRWASDALSMMLIKDQHDRRSLIEQSAPSSHKEQSKLSALLKPSTTHRCPSSIGKRWATASKKPSPLNKKSKNLWLKTFLKDGGHVGHKPIKLPISRLQYPHIGNFIIGDRNTVALMNSPLTLKQAIKGLYLSASVLRRQGHILVIDTRGETSSFSGLVKSSNDKIPTALSFSGSRWMGGSLTNWDSISIMVRRCAQISKQFDGFLAHNRIHIPRYEKMREAYPGFIKKSLCFKRRPDLLWVINPTENRNIIQEANRLNIPTIGLVDSNTDLSNITVPIPINTNTLFQSNKLITTLLNLCNSLSINNRKSY